MVKKLLLLFVVLFAFYVEPSQAQTEKQLRQIISRYDLNALRLESNLYVKDFRNQRERFKTYAQKYDIPLTVTNRKGGVSHFSRIDEKGNLIYLKAYSNVEAAKTIGVDRLYPTGDLELNLTGESMVVGLWDEGKVRGQHELLSGKVTQKDDAEDFGDHATQVAGTLIGKKLESRLGALAQGMAYNAKLEAYDWDDDVEEMYKAAANGLLISNHSYGPDLDQVKDPKNLLGGYDQVSAAVDNLVYTAPYYTIVNAAGNDRDVYARYNSEDGGYNLLAGEMSTAKNTLVVGSVYKVLDYQGPSSVIMSEFSSWGPTNDNRVKPDIVADGMFLLSSVAKTSSGRPSNTLYDYYSGTSAAAPSAAGGLLLLQELSAQLNNGEFLKSSTLKAIITTTAKPAGNYPGPDPMYGWGLLDVGAAAQLMLENDNQGDSFYEELTLQDQMPFERVIEATGDNPIKVTVAWTDPAGDIARSRNKTSVLVNDLDLRLIDEKGNVFYPWRLNPNDFSGPPLRDEDNSVDNIEQVFIEAANKGDRFRIEVTHKDRLKNNIQDFSLVVEGGKQNNLADLKSNLFIVYPNPGSEVIYIDLDKSYDFIDVHVFDLGGRLLLEKHYRGKPTAHETIDVSALAPGNYYLHVRTKEGKKSRQILIK